jgi:hypothetical protein
MFPANETILDRAIADPESSSNDILASGAMEKAGGRVDEVEVC